MLSRWTSIRCNLDGNFTFATWQWLLIDHLHIIGWLFWSVSKKLFQIQYYYHMDSQTTHCILVSGIPEVSQVILSRRFSFFFVVFLNPLMLDYMLFYFLRSRSELLSIDMSLVWVLNCELSRLNLGFDSDDPYHVLFCKWSILRGHAGAENKFWNFWMYRIVA